MKPTAKNITSYVNEQLKRAGSDNIAICLPDLDGRTFNALCANFKEVKKQPFGYIRFEK